MDFRVKSAGFTLLDAIPGGGVLYDFIQRYITKSLCLSESSLLMNFNRKVLYSIEMIKKYGDVLFEDATFYEFGAGWNLLTPIGLCELCSVKQYICIDLNEFMHSRDVKDTIHFINRNACKINEELNKRNLKEFKIKRYISGSVMAANNKLMKKALREQYNIIYKAPYDARKTDMDDSSVDYIISNVTLQHIPESDFEKIMRECYRIMKPGGVMVTFNVYIDHYAYYDKNIGLYNFLRYNDREWEKYNHPLHYQNRLRHCQYEKIFRKAGFDIVDEYLEKVTESHKRQLSLIPIDEKFKKYSFEELLIPGCHFVLKK